MDEDFSFLPEEKTLFIGEDPLGLKASQWIEQQKQKILNGQPIVFMSSFDYLTEYDTFINNEIQDIFNDLATEKKLAILEKVTSSLTDNLSKNNILALIYKREAEKYTINLIKALLKEEISILAEEISLWQEFSQWQKSDFQYYQDLSTPADENSIEELDAILDEQEYQSEYGANPYLDAKTDEALENMLEKNNFSEDDLKINCHECLEEIRKILVLLNKYNCPVSLHELQKIYLFHFQNKMDTRLLCKNETEEKTANDTQYILTNKLFKELVKEVTKKDNENPDLIQQALDKTDQFALTIFVHHNFSLSVEQLISVFKTVYQKLKTTN